MRTLIVISLIITLFFSCTPPAKIIKFNAEPDKIFIGDTIKVSWQVENADSISIIDENTGNIIFNKLIANNSKTFSTDSSIGISLIASNDANSDTALKFIVVEPKPIPPPPPPPIVKEEPNEDESEYLSGLRHIDNIASNSKLRYRIISFDRTKYPDSLYIKVIVQDDNGNFVANLAPPYGNIETQKKFFKQIIEIVEGDTNIVNDFTVREYHNEFVEPCKFSLVLDHSGSMWGENGEPIKALQRASIKFINMKRQKDSLSVVKFDHRIVTEVPLTSDDNEIKKYLKYDLLERYGGWTAMYAGGDVGVNTMSRSKNNKYLILFTDGYDNASFYFSILNDLYYAIRASELIYSAREKDIKIYTVGYGFANMKVLKKMAVLGDGSFYWADDSNEIEQIYSELPRLFQNYYLIAYKPIDLEGFHKITIKGSNPDGTNSNAKGSTYIGDRYDFPEEYGIPPQVVAFFDFNKSTVLQEYKKTVELFINYLKENKNYRMKMIGHTDLSGSEDHNMRLSVKRAKQVANMFVKGSIKKSRIEVIGMGETQPLHPFEEQPWMADENRRVEIVIYEEDN